MSDAVEKVKQAVKPQQHSNPLPLNMFIIIHLLNTLLNIYCHSKLSIQFTNHLFYL